MPPAFVQRNHQSTIRHALQQSLTFFAPGALRSMTFATLARCNFGNGEPAFARHAPRVFGHAGINPSGHALANGQQVDTHERVSAL
jgi:hypothetical protein